MTRSTPAPMSINHLIMTEETFEITDITNPIEHGVLKIRSVMIKEMDRIVLPEEILVRSRIDTFRATATLDEDGYVTLSGYVKREGSHIEKRVTEASVTDALRVFLRD